MASMRTHLPRLLAAGAAAVALAAPGGVGVAADRGTPSNVQLVKAHLRALDDCDAKAGVAGYAKDVVVFYPDGVVVRGIEAIRASYAMSTKPFVEGGFCGASAKLLRTWTQGDTTIATFRIKAPFLAEPYVATDTYVFRDGKIAGESSTFDATKLKFAS
jgi:limonene-1,2-epoxide hydrolase